MAIVRVVIGGESYEAGPGRPVMFGRGGEPRVVPLDPRDMGISATAGSIEHALGVWWVVNRSRSRRLRIEAASTTAPVRLECGSRHAITTSPLAVLVEGAMFVHRIEVHVPAEALTALQVETPVTTGTIRLGDVRLSDRDREALAAVFCGYLLPFPRHDPHPTSYQNAAARLGAPWTRVTVRKQVERVKERMARTGLFFEGAHANHDLAEHLIDNGLIDITDLERLDERLSGGVGA